MPMCIRARTCFVVCMADCMRANVTLSPPCHTQEVIDSSVRDTLSYKSDMVARVWLHVGGLGAYSHNAQRRW
jgi:hypothetical protein